MMRSLFFSDVFMDVAVVGSLAPDRRDDGNGSENFTEKVNSRCFKRHRSYSISFNLSNEF